MIRVVLALLIYASQVLGQNWEYTTVVLEPQPEIGEYSQFHILACDSGRTAFTCGLIWDWDIAGVYDSLGQRLWCQCGEGMFIEVVHPRALELVAKSGGFMALYDYTFGGNWQSRAFGRKYGGAGSPYQSVNLYDTATAIRATYDGNQSIFLCASTTEDDHFFIAGASNQGADWVYPLWNGAYAHEPWAFSLSTGEGIATAAIRRGNEWIDYAYILIDASGTHIRDWRLEIDSLSTEMLMCADPNEGFWAIAAEHAANDEDELRFYRSATNRHYNVPLHLTLPEVENGLSPTLHAVPIGDGVLIAGEASVEGTLCLFTAVMSANGQVWIDTLSSYTRMLDLSAFANGFTAAVRREDNGAVELLRARFSPSAVDDPLIPSPSSLELSAYPNPFNAQTTIQFDLPRAGNVTLALFDVLGREVEVLLNKPLAAGTHSISYSAASLPSGVYFVQLQSGSASLTHKLLLLK